MNERQTRILLVDDDSELLKTAKECLSLQGSYDIEFAPSAENAFELMNTNEYDVIVCDIQMPVTNGFEFLKELRVSGNTIPFIVFTVTEDKQTVLKAFALGANGFVGKYGKPEVVFSVLKRCIDEAVTRSRKKCESKSLDVI
jgi:CheY-like chemotaxis protein